MFEESEKHAGDFHFSLGDEGVIGGVVETEDTFEQGRGDEWEQGDRHQRDEGLARIHLAIPPRSDALADLVEEGVDRAPVHRNGHVDHSLWISIQLMDHEAGDVWMQQDGVDVGAHKCCDFFLEGKLRAHHLDDGLEVGSKRILKNGLEKLVF